MLTSLLGILKDNDATRQQCFRIRSGEPSPNPLDLLNLNGRTAFYDSLAMEPFLSITDDVLPPLGMDKATADR